MEAIWVYFKLQLPGYLRALPLPKTFDGFLDLTREDWLTLAPFFLTISIIIYLMITPFVNLCFSKEKRPRINRKHELNSPKVATTFDIEDLGDKKVFCRCWKSNKFPYCDGSHKKHNKDTGDNVGPLIVEQKKKEEEEEEKEPTSKEGGQQEE